MRTSLAAILLTTAVGVIASSVGVEQQECVASAADPNTCLNNVDGATAVDVETAVDSENVANDTDASAGAEASASCQDGHPKCASWAVRGECTANPNYMLKVCQLSCNSCPDADGSAATPGSSENDDTVSDVGGGVTERKLNTACKDEHDSCEMWSSQGECKNNPAFMLRNCQLSCRTCTKYLFSDDDLARGADLGELQEISRPNQSVDPGVAELIRGARKYLFEDVPKKFDSNIIEICQNKHAKCALWAFMGECEANPNYMKKNCAPVCKSCDSMTVEGRCPIDPDAPKAWAPGDLGKMFTKLTTEPFKSQYEVEILSSPDTGGPWVITMDNVVTEEEALRLIELGSKEGYERSADVGKMNPDGTYEKNVNDRRTSTNAWCTGDCFADPDAQRVVNRISNLTGIPDEHSENLQLLRYEPGQYYKVHHDYIPHHVKRQCGVRILTVYLYLNEVEEGGGTNFDQLDITVLPKRGRALLWPSVKDDAPDEKDPRTMHQALPVIKGVKYGANAWVHQGDFKGANARGCT